MNDYVLKTPLTAERISVGEGAANVRIPMLAATQKNFVLTDTNVYALHTEFFKKHFSDTPTFVLESGEENKNIRS